MKVLRAGLWNALFAVVFCAALSDDVAAAEKAGTSATAATKSAKDLIIDKLVRKMYLGRSISRQEQAVLTKYGREASALTGKERAMLIEKHPLAPVDFANTAASAYGEWDRWPTKVAEFEKMVIDLKKGGCNTIYCVYKEWRLPICRAQGVRMVIDVLAWHDGDKVAKRGLPRRSAAMNDIRDPRMWQRPRLKYICESVRNDDAVWGYNLWNETLSHYRGAGDFNLHGALIKKWGGATHPVWIGSRKAHGFGAIQGNPGVLAWYDYCWSRGIHWNLNLLYYNAPYAEKKGGCFIGKWLGINNYNKDMYALNTGIAYGMKICMWFIGWKPHLNDIGKEMQMVFPELGKIGRPVAKGGKVQVYSTPTTKTPGNRNKALGLPRFVTPFPKDHWLQVKRGEVLVGFYKYPNGDDAIYIANHNAFAQQPVLLDITKKLKESDEKLILARFNRKTGAWDRIELKDGHADVNIAPGDGALLALTARLRKSKRTLKNLGKPLDCLKPVGLNSPIAAMFRQSKTYTPVLQKLRKSAAETSDKKKARAALWVVSDVEQWARDAIRVAIDEARTIEGMKRAATLYQMIATNYEGLPIAQRASSKLETIKRRILREQKAWKYYQQMLPHEKKLPKLAGKSGSMKDATWAKSNRRLIDQLLRLEGAIRYEAPATMGATRALEMLQRYDITVDHMLLEDDLKNEKARPRP